MKQRPILFSTDMVRAILARKKTQTRRIVKSQYLERGSTPFHIAKKSPYGLPGDQLWVREAFVWEGETKYTDISPIGNFYYKADFEDGDGPTKWKPSIFMPHEAARIILEITEIRVERLHHISEDNAKAEGVMADCNSFLKGFALIWEKINGLESWFRNPWVWVITFKRIES